jgi:heat shock protein HslJ
MRHLRTHVALALLAGLTLAACGNDDADSPAGSSTTVPAGLDLDGRTFLSQSATDGGEPKTFVAGTQVTLRFADGGVSGSAGCNTMGADYTLDGDVLRLGDLSMTEMACDEDRMAQDEWLADLLMGAPTVALDGDTLTITGASASLELLDREVADPDRPLVGTDWTADTLLDGDAASSIAEGVVVELRFGEDGLVTIAAGCNGGSAPYEVDGSTITFGDAVLTLKACSEPEASVESHVLSVLDGEAEFEIEADRLTITNGDVGLGLLAS